jgi:hypothetical protein
MSALTVHSQGVASSTDVYTFTLTTGSAVQVFTFPAADGAWFTLDADHVKIERTGTFTAVEIALTRNFSCSLTSAQPVVTPAPLGLPDLVAFVAVWFWVWFTDRLLKL